MKKIITLVLALVMILSLAVPAAAATTNLTINDTSSHGNRTYVGYKLMTASVSADDINYDYTVNPTYHKILAEAVGLSETATSDEIVVEIRKIADRSEAMHHFANEVYRDIQAAGITPEQSAFNGTATLEQAYWLIVDVTDLNGDTPYANSLVMVDTVGSIDLTINNKPATTTSEKKIDDENDSLIYPSPESEDATSWQEVADYDIGDQVPYDINVYITNDAAEYTYYSIVMQDTVSKGLTYLPDTFQIFVNSVEYDIAEASKATTDDEFVYVIKNTADGQQLYVYPNYGYTRNDGTPVTQNETDGGDFLKMFPAGTAHSVINNAVIKFTYKCLLNENAVIGATGNKNEYTLKFSNNPYGDSFGETPKDTAIVLTYKLIVNKVDPKGAPLTGAKFTLYKFYAKAAETELTEDKATAKGYVHHDAANAWGVFEAVTTATIDGTGTEFTFNGLDDGYYKLEETEKPDGYNAIDPIEFQIEAAHVKEIDSGDVLSSSGLTGETLIGSELTFTADGTLGTLVTDIENRTGTELPSTGGIGTTIFYILGGMMFVGAAVLLVTKKRMAV